MRRRSCNVVSVGDRTNRMNAGKHAKNSDDAALHPDREGSNRAEGGVALARGGGRAAPQERASDRLASDCQIG